MTLRGVLVALVVAAAFVVGVAIERASTSDHHDMAEQRPPASKASGEAHGESGEADGAGRGNGAASGGGSGDRRHGAR